MHRRGLLASVCATIATGLAGCLGGRPAGSPTSTPADTEESPTTPATLSATFAVTGSACGTGEDTASVSFGSETVDIEGTIRGSDTCDDASLGDISRENETLTVSVVTVRPEGTPACGQCITDIDYVAEIDPAGPLPRTVTIRHDGETIRTVDRRS